MSYSYQPKWTSTVRIESGGRYPLGLNRFHDGLEDILIKGIVLNANRLRYVSYCCWSLGDIEKNHTCDDYAEFIDAFTRRENALALGLYLMNTKYSIYGTDSMSKLIQPNKKQYDCTFKLMQSNDLGAYGLYYAGTIYNWGLTETDEKGLVRLTQNGKKIYEIMDQLYQKSKPEYYRKYKGRKNVPANDLLEWAKINDFDNIRQSKHSKEREFYKSILFHLDKTEVSDFRRDTFAFFINCIDECSKKKIKFDEDILRNINYYSSYYNDSLKVKKFSVPKNFQDVHFYWSVYEGHVYFRWWVSKYFETFLIYLRSSDNGYTIDEFMAEIEPKDFNDFFKTYCGSKNDFFTGPMENIFKLFSGPARLRDILSEESVTSDEEYLSLSDILAKFVIIMGALYVRFKDIRSDERYKYLILNLGNDLWIDALFSFSNLEKIPVNKFLEIILKRYIINQHDSVMIEKNDLRRCWFTIENKRYFHQADVSLIWRPAKFSTIMTLLSDMKLIDIHDTMISVSRDGDKLYKKLLTEY